MHDLLGRAAASDRSSWRDLLDSPGIYVVQLKHDANLELLETCALAVHATACPPSELHKKNKRIQRAGSTDILYIGKGNNIRDRVRQLARFGVGRARNHAGGEWLWQVTRIGEATVVMQSTPSGKQVPFEDWLLDKFHLSHGDYPLANRDGPRENVEQWHPVTSD